MMPSLLGMTAFRHRSSERIRALSVQHLATQRSEHSPHTDRDILVQRSSPETE
jgi:hypothetical protein